MDKSDLILKELKEIKNHVITLGQKVDVIDKRVDTLEKKFDTLEKKVNSLEKRIDNNDSKIESLTQSFRLFYADNNAAHEEIKEKMETLNNAFIRFEAETLDKVNVLFDGHQDFINHKSIFANELNRLDKITKMNSYEISLLKKKA